MNIPIGIILQTTPVGLPQTRPNRFMTHVQQAGVFLTAETMVFGQRHWVHQQILMTYHYTTAPITVLTSPASSAQLPPFGTLFWVIWRASLIQTRLKVSKMSVTKSRIGLLLLTAAVAVTAHASPIVGTISTFVRRHPKVSRAVNQFVASKNKDLSTSLEMTL